MKYFKNIFVLVLALFLVTGGVWLGLSNKGDMVLWFNSHRSVPLDFFFKYSTHLGDGLVLIPLFIGLLLYRYYYGIVAVFTSLTILILSQVLKKTIFSGWPRPTAYFSPDIQWNYVEGVSVAMRNTFPSGHTISAWAVFFLLALVVNRRWAYILFPFLAIAVGLSRVYLLQHFFVDTYFGAVLGVLATYAAFLITDRVLGQDRKMKLLSKSPMAPS